MVDDVKIKKHKPFTPTMKIAVSYIVLIGIGVILLIMPFATKSGQSIGFIDALFTSASAVCVTGLAVLDTFSTFNFYGQFVIIFLCEIGGLGFMTVASLLMIMLGKRLSLKDKLSIAESFNDNDMSSAVKIAKTLTFTALGIELLGALCLLPVYLQPQYVQEGGVGLAIWRSIFHSIASFCNAGFDLMGMGLDGIYQFRTNPLFNIVTMTLIFCGAIGASVITNVARKIRHKEKMTFNSKLIIFTTLILLVVGTVYILIAEYDNPATLGNLPFGEKVMAALFQSMTTRSAGLATIDQSGMTSAGHFMTCLLMMIGSSPASTGGGVKLATVVVLLAALKTSVVGGDEYHFLKRGIARKTFNKAFSVLLFYLLALVGALMILCLTDGQFGISQLTFEAISALTNVGLSVGVVANLSWMGKIIFILLMYFGRAGFLCVVYSVVGGNKSNIKYADCKIIIG